MTMRRRSLIISGMTLLAPPGTIFAQATGKARRVGFLWGSSKAASEESGAAQAFAEGMRDAGYREQADYVVESRYASGQYSELEAIAQEVVRNNYDVIVTTGAAATQAVQKLTATTPVVFAIVNDATGFVKSLSRPGGNLTGLTRNTAEISPKHLEFLRIVSPKLNRVGLLINPGNPSHATVRNAVEEAGHAIGVAVVELDAHNLEEITRAFGSARELRFEAVIVPVDQLFIGYKREIAMLALKGRLPTMYATPDDVREGGLISYGPVYREFFRQAARYVDRILKGMRPADLPVEQPTKYELAINMKTAKALGIAIPQSLLLRADEVVQ